MRSNLTVKAPEDANNMALLPFWFTLNILIAVLYPIGKYLFKLATKTLEQRPGTSVFVIIVDFEQVFVYWNTSARICLFKVNYRKIRIYFTLFFSVFCFCWLWTVRRAKLSHLLLLFLLTVLYYTVFIFDFGFTFLLYQLFIIIVSILSHCCRNYANQTS